ncbi:dUTPase [Candidatus Peribacteria bacterium RIFCSPLOWO2_12_FULL_55_15]|nr:MAG: dUTPase [Candidatus Peribacteria bacterium RIFCSPHIGHO2_01_FULL_54_22]OGJ63357.1 MAG: dUTPase [Candidatus Peribacteria bacterium RIFCSPHIGHO2_02_FULL_55_24]OGJ64634.1 MAG: dUTPase [Candidatus Peribacteria bacterium RIFCSPHIGHO2_12_FULL_54_10]OGJ68230.1 MAG: dUTPase [Candidatus Peribacteria bacterium RIFCSPLOWO2_01_FULL_54_110]OGJ69739.1 MAG: dUTPase [Candidatus Peribacteria bacterium RIFCSPLOWO2_02_FULL_55_36]OGJ70337.1 MAG: dUTPase [Candidatus Peribacteria bacterium RIFCSPLOWO2_12_FUL
MQIPIRRHDQSLPLPTYETAGAVAFDFVTRETTVIPPKTLGLIPGNVIIETPKGYALLIAPRSSLPRKKTLMFPHSIGIIDQDYCGPKDEIMIQVYNFGEAPVTVERGERIAQGIFVKCEQAEWVETTIGAKTRGGFGSTGTKTCHPELKVSLPRLQSSSS